MWPGVLYSASAIRRPGVTQPTSRLIWDEHTHLSPFHLHDEVIQMKALWKLYRGSPQIKQTWLWKLPGILSGQLLPVPRMRDKTKGCIWSSVRAAGGSAYSAGCVCVTCLLEAAFCPVPKTTLSYIKALRRGIRCPSMLKTTFSFLGTRKPLFEKRAKYTDLFFLINSTREL